MWDFLNDASVQRDFLHGLLTTLSLTGIAGLLALLIGCITAFARFSGVYWLERPAIIYTEVFRNTPLLIQLYLYYRGLQSLGLMLSPELCGILALSLYSGAYLGEVFRAGLLALPPEQTDAGLALGLSRFNVYRLILVPQAVRLVLPAIGNQLISLAKNSSLVAFITVNDLFYVVYKGAVDHFQPVEYFLEGSALYLTVSLIIAGCTRLIEGWLKRPGQFTAPTPEAQHG